MREKAGPETDRRARAQSRQAGETTHWLSAHSALAELLSQRPHWAAHTHRKL